MSPYFQAFLEQLEADKEMRLHVNLYKGEKKQKTSTVSKSKLASERTMDVEAQHGDDVDDDNDDDDEKINLSELLDELVLTGGGAASDAVESIAENVILTSEQAAKIAAIHISTSGFEPSDYSPTDFKYT